MRWFCLDNNATTRVDPAVLDAMMPFLREEYANPSSGYEFARPARDALAAARRPWEERAAGHREILGRLDNQDSSGCRGCGVRAGLPAPAGAGGRRTARTPVAAGLEGAFDGPQDGPRFGKPDVMFTGFLLFVLSVGALRWCEHALG